MNNITITIEAPALAEALQRLAEAFTGAVPKSTEKPVKEKAVSESVVKESVKKEEAKSIKPETASTAEVGYTVEQVREALGKVSQDKGKAVARGILTKLDVKSVSDLQPEQFALAMQLIKEV